MIDNISTKRETVMGSSRETTPTEKKPLSFSISRILGTDEDKKTSSAADVAVSRNAELPRVPMTIIHHINQGADDSYYTNFESQVQPRACSTPENAEYPSPPSYYHNMPYHVVHPHGTYLAHSDTNISQTPEHTDIPLKPTFKYVDNSYDKSLDSLGESYHHSPSPLKAKKKKTRTVFSRSQIYQLETAFDMKRYLSSAERSGLASQLNLSETQIKIWFQNRRNKWKRQINGEMDEIPISSAFATGLLSPPFCQPSLNSLSHVRDPREELLRGSMSVPSYYSHPYMQETRMRPTYLH